MLLPVGFRAGSVWLFVGNHGVGVVEDGGCAGEPGAGGLAADIDEPAVAGGEVDGKARSAIRSSRIELGALAVDGVDVVAVASNECLQGGEPGTAVFFVVDFNSHSQLVR